MENPFASGARRSSTLRIPSSAKVFTNTARRPSGCSLPRRHKRQSRGESMPGPARGNVAIDLEECKGCGLCVESCPPKCLELATELNHYGVHGARYTGHDCTGCAICSLLLTGTGRSVGIPPAPA